MKRRIAIALTLGILILAIPSALELAFYQLSITDPIPRWLGDYIGGAGTIVAILLFSHAPTAPDAVVLAVLIGGNIIFLSLVVFVILTLIAAVKNRLQPRD
jgi:hypothetical protein